MFRTEALLLLGLASLLTSCGSDSSAQAGGTGSDFPIHPAVAVIQKPNGAMVQAGAWRLWSVTNDSLHYAKELPTTDNGFQLPDTGSWVVEAWGSDSEAGKPGGWRTLPLDVDFERCLNWLGRNLSSSSPSPAILGACRDLSSPTVQTRGGGDPRAVAAFRLPSARSPSAVVADSAGKALPSRIWRLWRATADTNNSLQIFKFAGFQASAENGSIELAGLQGTWVAEGWNNAPIDTSFRNPPYEAQLEVGLVSDCLGTSSQVLPRLCTTSPFDAQIYDRYNASHPDVVVAFRLPAK